MVAYILIHLSKRMTSDHKLLFSSTTAYQIPLFKFPSPCLLSKKKIKREKKTDGEKHKARKRDSHKIG